MPRHLPRAGGLSPAGQAQMLDFTGAVARDEPGNRLPAHKALPAWLLERS